jgi:hypothetical protein
MDRPRRHQNGEDGSARHLHILRTKQDSPALHPIGHNSANQREQKNGNAAQKLIEAEIKRGVTEAINQPALCRNLHPRADAGRARADEHQPKIAILKCFEDPAKQSK